MLQKFILFLLIVIASNSFACKPAIPITVFEIKKGALPVQPITPRFKIKKIIRGTRARGVTDCAWMYNMGSIELQSLISPKTEQGYIFEIVKGKLKDAYFNLNPVTVSSFRKDKSIYELGWRDKNSNSQSPLNITLKITAVSRSGLKSKPQFLHIIQPGTQVPWWNIWKKLPSAFTQTIEGDSFSQAIEKQ
jgi:hypothetical protein